MIAFLKGKILNKSNEFVIILVNNIGYKVCICQSIFDELNVNQEIELYIYQHVKEDALALYGFRLIEELGLFELLISVSGIGPKSALGVLSISSVFDIKNSISMGDYSLLVKASGIGKKTAERVVLELREKIGNLLVDFSQKNSDEWNDNTTSGDEIDALMALGYSMIQARDALQEVDFKIKDSGERIREALKNM